jgi:hypothetical protein
MTWKYITENDIIIIIIIIFQFNFYPKKKDPRH